MNFRESLLSFLQKNKIMALATTDNKQVYVCNLHYSSDDNFSLYFASTKRRKHSTNLEKHAECSVCIYDPDHTNDSIVSGVQMKGTAALCVVNEDMANINAFYAKFPDKFRDEKNETLSTSDIRVFYKFTPHRIRMMEGHSRDLPHEITLPEHEEKE